MKKVLFFFICFIFMTTNTKAINIYSNNMVLYNLKENIIVDELNKEEKISIASMTKIMTTLVALENIDNLNEKVKLTSDVFEGLEEANASVAGFKLNQVVSYKDLLYGTFLPSGADAANALALNLFGSITNFVKKMNEKAMELGLSNTHFVNVTGLDEYNHYSTVNDVAVMLNEALKNETFKEIFTSNSYTTSDKLLTFYSTLVTTLNSYGIRANYIVGGKTGYTLDAGRCLASIAYDSSSDIYYLLVTAKAPTTTNYYHLLDAKNIYEYYFENYGYQKVIAKDELLVELEGKYTKEKKIEIKSSLDTLEYLSNDFDKSKVELVYSGPSVIKYNTKKGTKLGTLDIIYDGKLLRTIDVNLNETLHFSLLSFIKANILLIAIIILFITVLIFKSKSKKKYRHK